MLKVKQQIKIRYKSYDFPVSSPANLKGTNDLTFTLGELLWSAITVGRANAMDVITYGFYSEYEILYRASILLSNLDLTSSTFVKKSPAYNNLDPSEKGAVSYFLGLTFTKLLAEKLLYTPWLMHLDVYNNRLLRGGHPVIPGPDKTRPDLLGLSWLMQWIVMESKGRSGPMETDLLNKAKNQTKNILSIGGSPIDLRVAVVTHFSRTGTLKVDWADPEGANAESLTVNTSPEEYLQNYYQLIYRILTQNDSFDRNGFRLFTFRKINLTVGLDQEIYNRYGTERLAPWIFRSYMWRERDNYTESFSNVLPEQEVHIGSDGILVGVGRNWGNISGAENNFNSLD